VLFEWLVRRELDDDETRIIFGSIDSSLGDDRVLETVEL